MFVLCTDVVITLWCTIILCCTRWNYDCTMQHNIPHCTALMWGHPTYMSMTVMKRCDVDLGGCRVNTISYTDVTELLYHCSMMKPILDAGRYNTQPHNQINNRQSRYHTPIQILSWPHDGITRVCEKTLCKDIRSARKRAWGDPVFLWLSCSKNPWDVTFPMAVVDI